MYPVACHVDVVSFAPSLMMSLTIAMGSETHTLCCRLWSGRRKRSTHLDSPFCFFLSTAVDYNLFQATRFMDGVRAKLDLLSAVTLMLHSAGASPHWTVQSSHYPM